MRIAIVGAGVIGLACAVALRRRGNDVVLIERREPGAECSSGNAGWICPALAAPMPHPGLRLNALRWVLRRESPLYIRPTALPGLAGWLRTFWRHCDPTSHGTGLHAIAGLARGTMDLFDQLRSDGVEFEMGRAGLLYAFLAEDAIRPHLAELRAMEPYGYDVPETLDADQLRAIEPAIGPGARAGIRVASERHVRPETLCAGLASWLLQRGAEIHTGVEAIDFDRAAGAPGRIEAVRVRPVPGPMSAAPAEVGRVEADAVVLAAGAWSGKLSKRLGQPLPLQAGKGYSITIEAPELRLRQPCYFVEAKCAVTPFRGSHRIAGTLELSGMNVRLDRRRVTSLVAAAERYAPGVSRGARRRDWVGPRPLLPDGLPAIGPLGNTDNAFIASGHAMLGMTLAPATGEAIADLVTGSPTSADLARFSPARFGAGSSRR